MYYLVRWEGYTAADDQWVHASGVTKGAIKEWRLKNDQSQPSEKSDKKKRKAVVLESDTDEDEAESEEPERSGLEGN